MRTTLMLLTAALCLSTSGAALAATPTTNQPTPSQTCKGQRTQMGTPTFKATYGTNKNGKNALGKCISKAIRDQATDQGTARSQCKTEQGDPTFAASHGGKTFAQFYGTNKNGKNALGTCVSTKARA